MSYASNHIREKGGNSGIDTIENDHNHRSFKRKQVNHSDCPIGLADFRGAPKAFQPAELLLAGRTPNAYGVAVGIASSINREWAFRDRIRKVMAKRAAGIPCVSAPNRRHDRKPRVQKVVALPPVYADRQGVVAIIKEKPGAAPERKQSAVPSTDRFAIKGLSRKMADIFMKSMVRQAEADAKPVVFAEAEAPVRQMHGLRITEDVVLRKKTLACA